MNCCEMIDKIVEYIKENKETVYSDNGMDSDEFIFAKGLLKFIEKVKKGGG